MWLPVWGRPWQPPRADGRLHSRGAWHAARHAGPPGGQRPRCPSARLRQQPAPWRRGWPAPRGQTGPRRWPRGRTAQRGRREGTWSPGRRSCQIWHALAACGMRW
ncbi:hypothetical protein F751_1442 [Auxenochlorella protothecoides]|uniref:Uncharacterized protein n=1 Tax=Auxenochlorella protothecoides TaxID=3075 RepID=A0A087SJC4_AUXPR|nr:hypothetical protein F751_1442 [Auxenochlorella protothecoides]KFM25828.1 hypothetical protein F751_1442 [Auxenochlorella protothecoides]